MRTFATGFPREEEDGMEASVFAVDCTFGETVLENTARIQKHSRVKVSEKGLTSQSIAMDSLTARGIAAFLAYPLQCRPNIIWK